jgi:hypothetical protein
MVPPTADEHYVIVTTTDDGNGSLNVFRMPTTAGRIVRHAEQSWSEVWREPTKADGPTLASKTLRPRLAAMGVGDHWVGPNYGTNGRSFDKVVRIAE